MNEDEDFYGRPGRLRAFAPTLSPDGQVKLDNAFRLYAGAEPKFADALRRLSRQWIDDAESLKLRATLLLVADLHDQGWSLSPAADHFVLEPPSLTRAQGEDPMIVKQRVQRTLRLARDRQLRETSVRQFIERMERPTVRIGEVATSIIDLIDDGAELAAELDTVRRLPERSQDAALRRVIDPVVEICEASGRCSDTGLALIDIWRYFRHSWSHEYRSIPGRQMMVLVRNAARPMRPVMGIAMLASPVMRLTTRDMWIGWLRPAAEAKVMSGEWKATAFVSALNQQIDNAIADIRWDDLLTSEEIAKPTEPTVFKLQQKAYGAAYQREVALKGHYEAGEKGETARGPVWKDAKIDWRAASEDLLFVRKRAEGLAELLFAKVVLSEFDLTRPTAESLRPLFESKRGQRAIDIALAEFRKTGLSSQVADVSVCGAVQPYNELLGGKLVAMMLTSREVRDAYARRYGQSVSVIASQMAGRPIVKPARLKILTTTSLYGLGSSQYNRLVLKSDDHWGIPHDLRWLAIGKSRTGGYGTLHLGPDTLHALRQLAERHHVSRRINNRFGEGTSPRLRQVREGLDVLGVQSDRILHHATPRIFYGCELEPDACRSLVSTKERRPTRAPSCAAIGAAWRRRWVLGRIDNPEHDILSRISDLGPESLRAVLRPEPDPDADQLELFA